MAELSINGSKLGTQLTDLLTADTIEPGSEPSYQLCKTIYLYHPLGAKMTDAPIKKAQSQARKISIPNSPEERVRDAYLDEWKELGCDSHIFNLWSTARRYGIASIGLMAEGVPIDRPIKYTELPKLKISFNVYDPLNTAGSLVLDQDTGAFEFQKVLGIAVNGVNFHPARVCVAMNELPVYISYTTSAFGFVGRSVYQRALFPLKSFVQSMRTDDMVVRKAGVLVAMIKQAGSIIDAVMAKVTGIKRSLLKEAETDQVISIGEHDKIESLNLLNLEGPYKLARGNVLKNVATSADMPAIMLENETLTEGFGEGTEDAKIIANFIDGIRKDMNPSYAFFDQIVMYRAWTPEFYKTIQNEFPADYGSVPYIVAFNRWRNSFAAEWPSLITEPDSEKVKVEKEKFEAIEKMLQVLLSRVDPENAARLIEWAADNLNENKMIFTNPLELDYKALASYEPPVPAFGNMDGSDDFARGDASGTVRQLITHMLHDQRRHHQRPQGRRGRAEDLQRGAS